MWLWIWVAQVEWRNFTAVNSRHSETKFWWLIYIRTFMLRNRMLGMLASMGERGISQWARCQSEVEEWLWWRRVEDGRVSGTSIKGNSKNMYIQLKHQMIIWSGTFTCFFFFLYKPLYYMYILSWWWLEYYWVNTVCDDSLYWKLFSRALIGRLKWSTMAQLLSYAFQRQIIWGCPHKSLNCLF